MKISRRALVRRLGGVGLGLPMVSALLAACSAPQPAAPTAAATAPAVKPTAAAAAPTAAPTTAPATAPTAAPTTAAAKPTAPVAATSAPAAAGGGSSKPKAVIGIVQEPTSMDPTADATASIATTLRDNLYEGLVRLDGSGKVIGSLAKSWDVSPDGTAVTFHLATGVKWHDGTPFTAQDVKFSWDRAADPNTDPVNPHRDYWAPVQSVDVVDDATVKVTLSRYSDNWLFHMGSGSACIVSSVSAANNRTNPIGTGPFKFGNWNHGASVTLARNEEYWGTKARLNEVEFRVFGDANALTNALRAGDIDAIGQVQDLAPIPQFQQDPNFEVLKGASSGKVMVSVNNANGPLSDKRVRQALYAAIDRKAWIDGFYFGFAEPIGSHATPNDGEPYFADMTSVNTYDPAKARQLLQDAGQSGLKVRLAQISGFPYAVRLTDVLASQLADIGVQLDVQPMEFPRWLQQVFTNGDYDLTIINHVEERDIGNYGNPKYYWHYDNPSVASMLSSADAEPDAGKRNGMYKQVLQTLADEAVNLWVAAPTNMAILHKGFQGYQAPGISPSLYLAEAYFA